LLDALEARGTVPAFDREQGRAMALRSYVPEPVTRPTPEHVYANVFRATVPPALVVCETEQELDERTLTDLRQSWAFVQASPRKLLAFDLPPNSVPFVQKKRLPEYLWSHFQEVEGKRSTDVVKELIRRSLEVACYRAGLRWC